MSRVHTLEVFDLDGGDQAYTMTCPGVDDDCRVLLECDWPGCAAADLWDNVDLDDGARAYAHGKLHVLSSGSWWAPTGTCYLVIADELADAAGALAGREGLTAGRYPVEHEFDELSLLAGLRLARLPVHAEPRGDEKEHC